jgi:hypothetical protein
MSGHDASPAQCTCTRRRLIAGLAAAAVLPSLGEAGEAAPSRCTTANGGTEPYPIPWLDKNGSHNQPAGPHREPSHIYHFQGFVARASTFVGMGTDNAGNRIPFGSPTTDFGFMSGEYWAARTTQRGIFAHI